MSDVKISTEGKARKARRQIEREERKVTETMSDHESGTEEEAAG